MGDWDVALQAWTKFDVWVQSKFDQPKRRPVAYTRPAAICKLLPPSSIVPCLRVQLHLGYIEAPAGILGATYCRAAVLLTFPRELTEGQAIEINRYLLCAGDDYSGQQCANKSRHALMHANLLETNTVLLQPSLTTVDPTVKLTQRHSACQKVCRLVAWKHHLPPQQPHGIQLGNESSQTEPLEETIEKQELTTRDRLLIASDTAVQQSHVEFGH